MSFTWSDLIDKLKADFLAGKPLASQMSKADESIQFRSADDITKIYSFLESLESEEDGANLTTFSNRIRR